ncbi:ABC transporter permease subunit [Planctomicrobium sp. SH527]|uniref:ABC transporter permease subunit n=1 Tax=Planctomicrobium sp. SH527 TaxID=3448123 RepID=UPI003F5C8BB3
MGTLSLLAQAPDEVIHLPYTALAIGYAVFIPLLLLLNYMTQSGVIARATTKEAVRQPVFLMMTAIGLTIITINVWVPFFSLGDDTKMYIDCGLATILICSLLQCVWTASLSVADEIEGRTAMTLLSKPINRRQFVFGKYIGIFQAALIMIAILAVVFFFLTYYKFHYDLKESSKEQSPLVYFRSFGGLPFSVPMMNPVYYEVARTIIPGVTLIAMEVAVMAAVSVAISTRVPMMMNVLTCFAVFVIGHLTPILAISGTANVFVKFVARFFATILPGLDHFNMSSAVATGKSIPAEYIGMAGLYCLAYVAAMIMIGFLLFEDRDLA